MITVSIFLSNSLTRKRENIFPNMSYYSLNRWVNILFLLCPHIEQYNMYNVHLLGSEWLIQRRSRSQSAWLNVLSQIKIIRFFIHKESFIDFFSLLSTPPQNGAKFNVKGFHNPPLVNNPVLANRGHTHAHTHTQYHRNTWRRRKRDILPVSLSR